MARVPGAPTRWGGRPATFSTPRTITARFPPGTTSRRRRPAARNTSATTSKGARRVIPSKRARSMAITRRRPSMTGALAGMTVRSPSFHRWPGSSCRSSEPAVAAGTVAGRWAPHRFEDEAPAATGVARCGSGVGILNVAQDHPVSAHGGPGLREQACVVDELATVWRQVPATGRIHGDVPRAGGEVDVRLELPAERGPRQTIVSAKFPRIGLRLVKGAAGVEPGNLSGGEVVLALSVDQDGAARAVLDQDVEGQDSVGWGRDVREAAPGCSGIACGRKEVRI